MSIFKKLLLMSIIICFSLAANNTSDPLDQASKISQSGAMLEAKRMQVAAENIANMDSIQDPSSKKIYKRKVVFAKHKGKIIVPKVKLDKRKKPKKIYSPEHISADKDGYIYLANINEDIEKGDMAESKRKYLLNLETFKTSENMKRNTINILK